MRNAYVFVICSHALCQQQLPCSDKVSTHGSEGCFQEVAHRRSRTLGLCVAVLNTRKLEHTLRRGGSDETGTTGSGDETAHDGADLAADLGGHGVGLAEVGTPVASPDGDDGELGEDDRATDGGGDLLGALDTEADVAFEVADGHEGLEAGALAGAGLLLDRHDLHDLILELGEEEVDDLVLLDGEREEVDLLHRPDLSILHEAAELGHRDPGDRTHIGDGWNIQEPWRVLTTPSPRPCGRHDGDHDGPVHGHHAHARNRHARAQSRPLCYAGKLPRKSDHDTRRKRRGILGQAGREG